MKCNNNNDDEDSFNVKLSTVRIDRPMHAMHIPGHEARDWAAFFFAEGLPLI